MISNLDLELLMDCLNSKSGTTEECLQAFSSQFSSQETFKPFFIMWHLMENNLLTQNQKVVALILMCQGCINRNSNHFVLHLMKFAEEKATSFERKLINELLIKNSKEIGKKPLKKLFQESEDFKGEFEFGSEIDSFRKNVVENTTKGGNVKSAEINGVIGDFGLLENGLFDPPKSPIPLEQIADEDFSLKAFSPDFLRPLPSTSSIQPSEVKIF